jgi:hypothetical protein
LKTQIKQLNLGVVLGAWTVYNATHPSRQNNVANLAVNIRKDFLFAINFMFLSLVDCCCSWHGHVIKILNQW